MRRLALSSSTLSAFSSTGVTLRSYARVEQPVEGFAVDVVQFAARSRIGRHPTRLWQLLLAVEGSGWVSGDDGAGRPLAVGQAALWAPGEEHASGTDDGLTAVVVQRRVCPLTEETP